MFLSIRQLTAKEFLGLLRDVMRLARVQSGKLAMHFERGDIIRPGCFFGCIKQAEIRDLLIKADACLPFPSLFMPGHSFVTTGISVLGGLVAAVFASCGKSKVMHRIIATVAIYMIYVKLLWDVHNETMHLNLTPLPIWQALCALGIKRCSTTACLPIPPAKPFVMVIVNNGKLTASEGYCQRAGWQYEVIREHRGIYLRVAVPFDKTHRLPLDVAVRVVCAFCNWCKVATAALTVAVRDFVRGIMEGHGNSPFLCQSHGRLQRRVAISIGLLQVYFSTKKLLLQRAIYIDSSVNGEGVSYVAS